MTPSIPSRHHKKSPESSQNSPKTPPKTAPGAPKTCPRFSKRRHKKAQNQPKVPKIRRHRAQTKNETAPPFLKAAAGGKTAVTSKLARRLDCKPIFEKGSAPKNKKTTRNEIPAGAGEWGQPFPRNWPLWSVLEFRGSSGIHTPRVRNAGRLRDKCADATEGGATMAGWRKFTNRRQAALARRKLEFHQAKSLHSRRG